MLLTIYDRNGRKKAEVEAGDSSTQQKEVQGDNVLTLSFVHYAHISLDVNDYTDFEGERYWLMERYVPAQKSDGEWAYDVKLYGIESIIKRFLVLETTDGDAEPVFTLTAPPREHVAMIVKCVNAGMGTENWKVGQVNGTELITIDYEGKYCDEALKEIAGKVGNGAEWWVEGQTMNVCRCEHGEEISLGYGKGLTELGRDVDSKAKFYTRLFPIGSSRNIDPEKYGSSRLMLPGGQKYVETHTDEYGIYDHYEKDAFSDIFPKRIGTVSGVRSMEAKDEDGNDYTIYYIKDDTLSFDPNDYELAGETKRISFQSGDLNGLGTGDDHYFEVNFDSDTKEFEIVTIWPGDGETQLPGGALVPKVGDTYLLWNIRMPDEYYPMAEEELLAAVEQYNAEHWRDISVYKGPTDHVWVEDNHADLYVGRRVRLESDKYFPETGYRSSRITKITRKVNLPSQMDIEISDALQTGALERVNDKIGEVRLYVKSAVSGQLPDVIRTGDNTLPTDNNLFSARRSQNEFLSRLKDDIVNGIVTFLRQSKFKDGAQFGETFMPGLFGHGGRIDGGGYGEFRGLKLWEWLEVPELRYNKVSIYIGIRWDAFGGGIIEEINPDPTGAETGTGKLKLEDGELGAIKEGDLCMGIWHDTSGNAATDSDDNRGNFSFAGFKTVYFQITGVSGASNESFTYMLRGQNDGGNGIHPFVGMHFAGRGNISDEDRQSFTYTTTKYSVSLTGVKTWEFQPDNYYEIHGHLDGFSMPAIDKNGNQYVKTFEGYGQVFGNAYIFGKIDAFERIAYRCFVEQSLGGSLAPGETESVAVTVLNGYGKDVTSEFTLFSVTRNTGDAASDALWDAQHTNVNNPFPIAFSDLGIDGIHKIVATFTVTASNEGTGAAAKATAEYFS